MYRSFPAIAAPTMMNPSASAVACMNAGGCPESEGSIHTIIPAGVFGSYPAGNRTHSVSLSSSRAAPRRSVLLPSRNRSPIVSRSNVTHPGTYGCAMSTFRASGVGVNLVQDTGSALVSRNALPSLSYTSGLVSNTVARSNPRVISLEDGRRALVVASGESVLSGSGQVFATFTIDLSTVRTTMGFALSPSAPYIPWGDVALAPASGRAVAVWEQDTYEGGTWTRSYGY